MILRFARRRIAQLVPPAYAAAKPRSEALGLFGATGAGTSATCSFTHSRTCEVRLTREFDTGQVLHIDAR